MPNWDGIEDVSSTPQRVWLSRKKENDPWLPLRKMDCRNLNESKEATVIIDGGRATANKETGTIEHNFHRAPVRELRSAAWFVRKDPNNKEKETNLEPIWQDDDTEKIETFYQTVIEATSSFGQGIDSLLSQAVELEDKSKVMVVKTGGGNTLSMKKRLPGFLAGSLDLQRGYGAYEVEGEKNELMLGPLKHLIFFVHGIGESLWSREDSSVFGMIEEVDRMRISIQKRQVEEWKKNCEKAQKGGEAIPLMPDRIEFIPIEWYDKIHSSSNALSKTLQSITLPSIPALRGIANEAVFDVLMYITPSFCEQVLETVSLQITKSYEKFLEVHPTFLSKGGKCHLAGHSLGSVIVWDLLTLLKEFQEPVEKQKNGDGDGGKKPSSSLSGGVQIVSDDNNANIGYQAYAEENTGVAHNGSWGPTLPKKFKGSPLPFVPQDVIFLGSPIGMFLTLRGCHPVFDELRKKKAEEVAKEHEEKLSARAGEGESPDGKAAHDDSDQTILSELPYAAPFTLPLEGGLYNIFSQSDPVAYRLEPLLLPPDMDIQDIPGPVHLTVQGQGVRLHVKAQQIGDEIAKAMEGKAASISNLFSQAATVLGKSFDEAPSTLQIKSSHSTGPAVFPLGGKSQRVDYQLQKGVVDNEYLSAITAHSTYFTNTDFLDFVANIGGKVPQKEVDVEVPDALIQTEITKVILNH